MELLTLEEKKERALSKYAAIQVGEKGFITQ
jgi:hypothetical protein